MGALAKPVVDAMTHIVAAGQGTFPNGQRASLDLLRQLGWITIRQHGPNIICTPTDNGRRAFTEYLKREK